MRRQKLELSISRDGAIRFIYDDAARFLLSHGEGKITRASHVEPDGVNWKVDLSPVNGPTLYGFRYRQTALDFEVEWLKKNWL